jgi:hypothetical protein
VKTSPKQPKKQRELRDDATRRKTLLEVREAWLSSGTNRAFSDWLARELGAHLRRVV